MHVYKVTANSLILAKAGVMLLQAARELTHMGVVWIHSNGGGGLSFYFLVSYRKIYDINSKKPQQMEISFTPVTVKQTATSDACIY